MLRNPDARLGVILLLSALSWGRAEDRPAATIPPAEPAAVAKPAGRSADEDEGLWPSRKLMRLMLTRWADDTSAHFELDVEQRDVLRERVVDRWGDFLESNRKDIQPLINEFLEMRVDSAPPDEERVKKWAERAEPVFGKFREQVSAGQDDIREILPFLKQAKFEVEALGFNAGMQFAEAKLKKWKEGEYEPDDFWDPPRGERRKRRVDRMEERQREAKEKAVAAQEAAPAQAKDDAPADQIALEVDSWEAYVKEFIKLYELDDGQKTTALSVLGELKERALAHRDRRKDDIARLEQRIQAGKGGEEEAAEVKKQLTELYGPVDEMFRELRDRLEQLPTAAQRERAATHGADRPNEKPAPPKDSSADGG